MNKFLQRFLCLVMGGLHSHFLVNPIYSSEFRLTWGCDKSLQDYKASAVIGNKSMFPIIQKFNVCTENCQIDINILLLLYSDFKDSL